MRTIRSTITFMITVAVFTGLYHQSVFAQTRKTSFQISPYIGTSLSVKASDMHGDHFDFLNPGQFVDYSVTDVELEQDMILGIDGRFYFHPYLGLDVDISYSLIKAHPVFAYFWDPPYQHEEIRTR